MADNDTQNNAPSPTLGSGSDIMGALSSLAQDPIDKSRMKDAYFTGIMQPTHGGSTAESVGGALAEMDKVRSQQEALRASYIPHVTQALIQAAQFQRQQAIDNMMIGILSGNQGQQQPHASPPAPMPGQLGSGTYGIMPPPSGMPAIPPDAPQGQQQPQGQNGLQGMPANKLGLMKYFGKDLMPEYRMANFGEKQDPGATYAMPDGSQRMAPDVAHGVGGYDYKTNSIVPIGNYSSINAGIKGDEAGAVESAKNDQTMVDPSKFQLKGAAASQPMTLGQLTRIAQGSPQGDTQTGGLPQHFMDAVTSTESGGNPNAVSPKGALGTMQVMPKTLTDPGFGVTPAKDNSAEEKTRVGQDYITALHSKYQDPTIAAIAYNMGPTATDTWLSKGGDFSKLPPETKNYVASVMTKSAVNARQSAPKLLTPAEIQQRDADIKLANAPKLAAATDDATTDVKNFQAYKDNLAKSVDEQRGLVQRNQEILPLLNQFQTGRMGADGLLQLSSTVQNMFPDSPTAKKLATLIAGGDVSAGQELNQLLSSAGLSNVIQTLQGQGRVNNAEFKALAAHAESSGSDPDTLRRLMDYQNKLYTQGFNEQQGIAEAEKKGTLNPKTWRADYSKKLNDAVLGAQTQPVSQPVQKVIDNAKGRTVTRTGMMNGKKVVQYADGTVDYAK